MPGSSIGKDALVGLGIGGAASALVLAVTGPVPGAVSLLAAAASVVWRLEDVLPAVPEWLRWAVLAALLTVFIVRVYRWTR